jgi:diguanylate cyclase (GGDEF)-like protein
VFATRSLSRSDAQRSRQAFSEASLQVASTLRLAFAREKDLVTAAGAFYLENPNASPADFERWTHEVGAFASYPELEAVATVAFVPRSHLLAFEAHAAVDGLGPLGSGGTAIVRAGVRPYYCFVTRSQTRGESNQTAPGVDYCATDPALIMSRTSGRGFDYPISVPALSGTPLLAIETPLYRNGRTPTTVIARRADFVGWTGTVIVPQVLLNAALLGHPGMAASLDDSSGSRLLAFTAGRAPRRSARMTINLDDGATVETYATVGTAGLFTNGNSRAVLLAGGLLSAVLFLLALVLITARGRALRLVGEKTEQLSYQALHDTLTTLPNRALVIDRAELMLARARRQDTPIATMFIDVDGFKQVNDTFGHSAGDQYLQTIATRLSSVIRETDTVGRLGGDEFVVLVEGETLVAGAELVAERLLAVLRQPLELDGALGRPQSCSASIGVAVGQRATAEQLLHDADLAMYEAKQAGKDCYVLFEESMQTDSTDRLELEADLGAAMANDELFLGLLTFPWVFHRGSGGQRSASLSIASAISGPGE